MSSAVKPRPSREEFRKDQSYVPPTTIKPSVPSKPKPQNPQPQNTQPKK